jgi:hypothetical protein
MSSPIIATLLIVGWTVTFAWVTLDFTGADGALGANVGANRVALPLMGGPRCPMVEDHYDYNQTTGEWQVRWVPALARAPGCPEAAAPPVAVSGSGNATAEPPPPPRPSPWGR